MPRISSHANAGEVTPTPTVEFFEQFHAVKSFVMRDPSAETSAALRRLFQQESLRMILGLGSEWLLARMVKRGDDWKPDARRNRTRVKRDHGVDAPWAPFISAQGMLAFREKLVVMRDAGRAAKKPARDPELEHFAASVSAILRHRATSRAIPAFGPANRDHVVLYVQARQPLFCPLHDQPAPCELLEYELEGERLYEAICCLESTHRFPPLYEHEKWYATRNARPRCHGCDQRDTVYLGERDSKPRSIFYGCPNCSRLTVIPMLADVPTSVQKKGDEAVTEWLGDRLKESGWPTPRDLARKKGLPFGRRGSGAVSRRITAQRLELTRVRYFMQHVGYGNLQNPRGLKAPVYRLYLRARALMDVHQGFIHAGSVYAAWAQDFLNIEGRKSNLEGSAAVRWVRNKFPHVGQAKKRKPLDKERAQLWKLFEEDAQATGVLQTIKHYAEKIERRDWTGHGPYVLATTERRKFLRRHPEVTTIWDLKEDARKTEVAGDG